MNFRKHSLIFILILSFTTLWAENSLTGSWSDWAIGKEFKGKYDHYEMFGFYNQSKNQSHGHLRLPYIFSHDMVLQRGKEIKIWGWAKPKAKVSVHFNGARAEVISSKQGKWSCLFDPLKANSVGQKLEVKSEENFITLNNVVVGDVWLCSGQSNMEMNVGRCADKTDKEAKVQAIINSAQGGNIRHFKIMRKAPSGPVEDSYSKWELQSPTAVRNWTAVGYFFAKYINEEINVPIGIINNAWGGTRIEAWMPLETLEKNSWLESTFYQRMKRKCMLWNNEDQALIETYNNLKENEYRLNKEKGKKARKYWGKAAPFFDRSYPATQFNGTVAPYTDFAIRGFLWYQGEANSRGANLYSQLFPAMIKDWRRLWQDDSLPFYWVQLAGFDKQFVAGSTPADAHWAELWEAQSKTLALAHTGQAVTYDLGNPKDVHPKEKLEIGERLSKIALNNVYGINIVYRGPTYTNMIINKNQITLNFENVGSGLMVGDKKPWKPVKVSNGSLNHFAIAGEDRVFHWAKAVIKGNTVIVSSDKVTEPIAVRYAWAGYPEGANLYNKEGFPACSFRTDTWPLLCETMEAKELISLEELKIQKKQDNEKLQASIDKLKANIDSIK